MSRILQFPPYIYRLAAPLAAAALFVFFLAACSTTSAIPDDEQLYVGIDKITYNDDPSRTRKKGGRDSVGVITAVGHAVEALNDVLKGGSVNRVTDMLAQNKKDLTKAERKALREEQKKTEADFATAKTEVEAVLAYPPNNALFGSSYYHSPLQIGLWMHNAFYDSKDGLGKWLFNHFGTEPVLVSNVSPEMRAKVATNTLHNYGYFHGKVGYDVVTQSNRKKAKVGYQVHAGQLYRLDSIAYLNYPASIDSTLRAHASERLLKKGDAFSVVNLSGEQTRIENLLRENGYYYFNAAYTTFRADTIQRPNYVQLQVLPAEGRSERADHPWYIGRVYVSVRNSDQSVLDNSFDDRNYTFQFSGKKLPLRASMWRHAITHRSGKLYRLTDQKNTLTKLGEMGVLSQMDVNYVARDTTATCDTLDVVVTAVMDKLYDSTFEMNATMKSNQQVGPGISYELAKRNAFRGGEKVSFKLFGSYEWQTGTGGSNSRNSLLNSYEIGTQLALKFPRFMFPGISHRKKRFPSSTQFALDADWKNRSKFYNMVSMGVGVTYNWYKKETLKHELNLFSLEFDKLNHTTAAFDSIMNANPALYVSMRNQFVPSLSYTLTYQTPSGTANPLWVQVTAKEAGNVTSACYAAAGKSFTERDKNLFGNPFAQFVKVTAEVHKVFRLTQDVNIATRFFGGVAYAYGNSSSVPYADQFYVGGANSIRAFTVRSIGPGSYRAPNSRYSYMDQTGDIKLEANAELRAKLFGDLHGAVFLDAGNVWLMRNDPKRPGAQLTASTLKNIALGTGAGIRYDLDFLVLRFDVGIALHAPYQTAKSGFYNIERFKDGLGLHFAIGYPF